MNQQPDKLFRDKLEGYNRPAPTSAWDKIDAGLQKKNNKGFSLIWKIAASLLLLAIATYVLWPTSKQQNQVASTERVEDKNITKKEKIEQPATTPNEKAESVTQTQVLPKDSSIQKQKDIVEDQEEEIPLELIQEEITPVVEENTVAVLTEEKTVEPLPTAKINTTEAVVANASTPDHTLTLVVTAKEADEYLNKKELAQATSEEKKPSTLKKLLKKAGSLTTDQDPFGELRQKKNEILALNFKTEKQRGQNK